MDEDDKIIDMSVESALSNGSTAAAPVINLSQKKTTRHIRRTPLPNVAEQIVRIHEEADPVGLLIDITNGNPIECHVVDEDGKIKTFYETPTLKMRERVARFLVERYMPKMSVTKVVDDNSKKNKSWSQLIEHAASACDEPEGEEGA